MHTLAAGRALRRLMGAAVTRDDGLEDVVAESRRVADKDFSMLPDALRLARDLDDELATTGGKAISARLVGEIAADGTRPGRAGALPARDARRAPRDGLGALRRRRGATRRDRPAPRPVLTVGLMSQDAQWHRAFSADDHPLVFYASRCRRLAD